MHGAGCSTIGSKPILDKLAVDVEGAEDIRKIQQDLSLPRRC